MRFLLMATAIILSCLSGIGQQRSSPSFNLGNYATADSRVLVPSVDGHAYFPTEYSKLLSGTPFFQDNYLKGELFDGAGKVYTSNAVRLNLFRNEVNFLDPVSNKELVVTTPIKWLRLTDTTNGLTYTFTLGDQLAATKKNLDGIWFQILVNDRVSLCRQQQKSARETITFGQDPTTNISTNEFYYLNLNGSLIRLAGWKSLQEKLADQKEALDQYIRDHQLKGRSADDYIQLVEYYNSITNK
jgi:hypothetical protein